MINDNNCIRGNVCLKVSGDIKLGLRVKGVRFVGIKLVGIKTIKFIYLCKMLKFS